jgi:hypothetical protein
VLDFTSSGGELLILNGGSRAEELVVVTTVDAAIRTERRSSYCIDSGTSMQLFVPLEPTESAADITLRIIGGHGEMILAPPYRKAIRRFVGARAWSTVLAATLLLLLAGGRLDSTAVVASADPEPAPADAPLIRPNVSLRVAARLPNVVASRAVAPHLEQPVASHLAHVPTHRALSTVVAMAALPAKHVELPRTPAPLMTDLKVPATAKSGDFIPVSFGAVARQVKIVASIGPTVVSKTIIGAQRGVIAIRSPRSDLDSRVMTVRAYAQDGNRTSTLQAMVILVRP